MQIALRILAIIFLKAGPQHLPYSISLLSIMILLYITTGVLVLTTSMEFSQALANMMLYTAVLYAFSFFCLSLLNYRNRLVQMVTALAGIGVVYHLLVWPLFIRINSVQAQEQDVTIAALLMLLLISWQVLVFASVFRQTMQMSMGRSLALSFGYLFLSMAAAEIFFPGS